MTKEEQRKMERLEVENRLLREQNSKHLEIYRTHLEEIVTLKGKVEAMTGLINELSIIAIE